MAALVLFVAVVATFALASQRVTVRLALQNLLPNSASLHLPLAPLGRRQRISFGRVVVVVVVVVVDECSMIFMTQTNQFCATRIGHDLWLKCLGACCDDLS